MEYWKCPARIPLLLIPAAVIFLLFVVSSDGGAVSTAVIDIEQDSIRIDVSGRSHAVESVDVTVRSTSARNVILDVSYDLVAPPTWSVDGPGKLFMEPLSRKNFQVDIIVPPGELAELEGEMTISASVEGDPGMEVGSDSVSIRIKEFRRIVPLVDDDYISDLPPQGELELKMENLGNVETRFLLLEMNGPNTMPGAGDGMVLAPGEIGAFTLEYSLDETAGEQTMELSSYLSDGTVQESFLSLRFIRDGDLFHLLFRNGPFLIISPTIDPDDDRISVFSLDGDLENIGLEIVDGPPEAYIEMGAGPDLENLDRKEISFRAGGFTGAEVLKVRAYGFSKDGRVYSNTIFVTVRSSGGSGAPFISTRAAVAGGSTVAAVTLTAGTAAYLYSASEVFRYKWLLLALVPLYSMTKGEKILDHFFRGRLFEHIRENPGVTFTALKEHFDVNNGTLTYHLHRLEREELITYRNLGKYKMFYAEGMRIRGCEVVISPLDREMLGMISDNPGMTTKQVITSMKGIRSQRTISRHIKQLERKGFLVVERTHGARRLFVSEDMERVLMPHRGVMEAVDVIGSRG